MADLIKGFEKFYQDIYQHKQELFEKLAHQQEPQALFITCSDLRVSPNLLRQTEPGDLFILRNAGNRVPPYGAVIGERRPPLNLVCWYDRSKKLWSVVIPIVGR